MSWIRPPSSRPKRRSAGLLRLCWRHWRVCQDRQRGPSRAQRPAGSRGLWLRFRPRQLQGARPLCSRPARIWRRVLRATRTTKRGGLNIVGPFEGTSVEADVARRLAVALRARRRADIDDLVPPGRQRPRVGVVASRTIGLPLRREPARAASGPNDRLSSSTPVRACSRVATRSGSGFGNWRSLRRRWPTRLAWCTRCGPRPRGAASASSVFGGPVHRIPVPVGGDPTGHNRGALGLPGGFVFACSVDFDNGFARQNPLGALAAYLAAFSPQDGHHLVIDASHADRYPQEHARLVGLADGRPDVAIRHSLSVTERDRLLASADCYLSLHRADGGLGSVAKAMSWGTFTVVTATPESLEFQTDQDSGLVRSETVAVPADEYRYPSGASWAEPDLGHASFILRSVVGDPDATATKVRRARRVAVRPFRSISGRRCRSRPVGGHRRAICTPDSAGTGSLQPECVITPEGDADRTAALRITAARGRARALRCPTAGRPRVRCGDYAGPAAPAG